MYLTKYLMKLKGPPGCLQAEITTNRTITHELWALFVHIFLFCEAQVEISAQKLILFMNLSLSSMNYQLLLIFHFYAFHGPL